MARYIDVEPLPHGQLWDECTDMEKAKILGWILQQPTADVVEVKHGKWEIKSEIYQMLDDVDEEIYVECPYCKRTFYVPFEFEDEKILAYARKAYPYCNCGAKMDGGSDK